MRLQQFWGQLRFRRLKNGLVYWAAAHQGQADFANPETGDRGRARTQGPPVLGEATDFSIFCRSCELSICQPVSVAIFVRYLFGDTLSLVIRTMTIDWSNESSRLKYVHTLIILLRGLRATVAYRVKRA